MNSIVVLPEEVTEDGDARLVGERARRACDLHELEEGISVRASIFGGPCGFAEVLQAEEELVRLKLSCDEPSPPLLPISLIVGLCRPQSVKKIVQAAVCFGVQELYFVRTERSQKSYLDAEVLSEKALLEQQLLGLEQSCSSQPIKILIHKRFKPFMEDVLPSALEGATGLLAVTPRIGERFERSLDFGIREAPLSENIYFAVGGEAGFNEFEVDMFQQLRFASVSLGERVLRVEQAVIAGIGAILQATGGTSRGLIF